MPLVRRCPRCGDDLGTEESVCVFCGHAVGRAGWWERVRLHWEDWLRIGAILVVAYIVGLELILWGLGWVAPAWVALVRSRPALEHGLRSALALGVAAAMLGPGLLAARRLRRR